MTNNKNIKMRVSECCQCNISIEEFLNFNSENEYLLIYFQYGQARLFLDDRNYVVKENYIALIQPRKSAIVSAMEENAKFLYFRYIGGEANYLYGKSVFRNSKPIYRVKGQMIERKIENIFHLMAQQQNVRYRCVAEIYQIFSQLFVPERRREAPQYVNTYLQNAIAEIESNLNTPISVGRLAEHVNVDRSYLYQIFLKETGMSPRQYINDYKLRVSAEQFALTDIKIESVFEQLGFSSYHAAEDAFKRKFGMNPKEYRAIHQKIISEEKKSEGY